MCNATEFHLDSESEARARASILRASIERVGKGAVMYIKERVDVGKQPLSIETLKLKHVTRTKAC